MTDRLEGSPLEWRALSVPSGSFACGRRHSAGPGTLDERARRLSHEELAVAEVLAAEGHDVTSLPESRRGGRRPDLSVCGSPVEVKSFVARAERRADPSPQSVFNKLADAAGQAPHVVLVANGSGLTAGTARRGMALYTAGPPAGRHLASVRVLGDGFDLAWAVRRGLVRDRLGRCPEPRQLGL